MKQKIFIIVMLIAFCASCGSSRKVIEAQNQHLREEIARQKALQRPTRTVRTLDPCEQLAIEESQFFRAAGSAIAKNESEAKSAALTDARNQLAQMVRVVVNGASQDYSKSNTSNYDKSVQLVGENIMNQYVYQSIDFTKPIKWSIYDLSDGTIQVYVCVEMTKEPEELTAELRTTLLQRPTIGIGASPYPSVRVNPMAEELYNKGRENCISNNHDLGIPQLMQAIEIGSLNAMYFVGRMYLFGDNVEKDTKIAFQYILSAANSGHKEAIFQVAEMYNSGTGTMKNKTQAKYWYRRADDVGDSRAKSRLRRL